MNLIRSIVFLFAALATPNDKSSHSSPQPRSYLELPRASLRAAPPVVIERVRGNKKLVVLGTRHTTDPSSPMFAVLERIFDQVKPEVVIHEAQISQDLKTASRDAAISGADEVGFVAVRSFKDGFGLRSGEPPLRDEIATLLESHSPEEVLVFMTTQRLIGNVKNPDVAAAARDYSSFLRSDLEPNGLPIGTHEHTWDGFLRAYAHVEGKAFSADTYGPALLDPTLRCGPLSQLARDSDAIRDRQLVAVIREELHRHDRVIVVFGRYHVLAVEPLLSGLLESP